MVEGNCVGTVLQPDTACVCCVSVQDPSAVGTKLEVQFEEETTPIVFLDSNVTVFTVKETQTATLL